MQTVLDLEAQPPGPTPASAAYRQNTGGFEFVHKADCWPWPKESTIMLPHPAGWFMPARAGCSWAVLEFQPHAPHLHALGLRNRVRPAFVDDFGTLVRVAA